MSEMVPPHGKKAAVKYNDINYLSRIKFRKAVLKAVLTCALHLGGFVADTQSRKLTVFMPET